MYRISASLLALTFVPAIASADILPQFVGLFNIFVGLMLTAAFLFFGSGLFLWAVRLGTWPTYRDYAIHLMMWGVVVLFVLVVLLAVVQFVQHHAAAAAFLVGLVVVLLVVWLILSVVPSPSVTAKEEEH